MSLKKSLSYCILTFYTAIFVLSFCLFIREVMVMPDASSLRPKIIKPKTPPVKKNLFLLCFLVACFAVNAQSVNIDGRLKPHLDAFFDECKKYGIDYHEKLFKLKNITIVDTLPLSEDGYTLGMLQRDADGNVENIIINWVTLLDPEILKVVAFHEFAHYFLDYKKHVCSDCGIIMAKVNTSYFDIVREWEQQVKNLFEESPAYQRKKKLSVLTMSMSDQ